MTQSTPAEDTLFRAAPRGAVCLVPRHDNEILKQPGGAAVPVAIQSLGGGAVSRGNAGSEPANAWYHGPRC